MVVAADTAGRRADRIESLLSARLFVEPQLAGDRLTFASRVEDVFRKKGGALTFIIKATDVSNQLGLRVAEVHSTIVVRKPV